VKTLNLSKYISEIVTAVGEAKIKASEIENLVYICSLMHQRYREFSTLLLEEFRKLLPTKKTDVVCICLFGLFRMHDCIIYFMMVFYLVPNKFVKNISGFTSLWGIHLMWHLWGQ